ARAATPSCNRTTGNTPSATRRLSGVAVREALLRAVSQISRRRQHAHLALRRGDHDVPRAERLEDRLVDLGARRAVVGRVYPRGDRQHHARIAQPGDAYDGLWILQRAGIRAQDLVNGLHCGDDVGLVGHTDLDAELPDAVAVVQDLADDLAVGDHHLRHVGVPERGAEEGDVLHRALLARHRDEVADLEGTRHHDRQPRDTVAENALHRERYPGAGDAETGNERQQLHAQVLQRHDREKREHQHPGEPGEERAYGRLEVGALQSAPERTAGPAAREVPGDQDQDRDQQLGRELDAEIDRGGGDLIQILQVLQRVHLILPEN